MHVCVSVCVALFISELNLTFDPCEIAKTCKFELHGYPHECVQYSSKSTLCFLSLMHHTHHTRMSRPPAPSPVHSIFSLFALPSRPEQLQAEIRHAFGSTPGIVTDEDEVGYVSHKQQGEELASRLEKRFASMATGDDLTDLLYALEEMVDSNREDDRQGRSAQIHERGRWDSVESLASKGPGVYS